MFVDSQSREEQELYYKTLKSMCELSDLFSESSSPYLGYRAVENIFCYALNAKNLSRSDCSVDASKNRIGIGIKTFLNGNGRTFQKVAEFNKDSHAFRGKNTNETIEIVSGFRNERIEATKRIYNLDSMIYHCVVREPNKILVYECPMEKINIKNIKNIKANENVITFDDQQNEYSFNKSKSTLYKRFVTKNVMKQLKIKILDNPYDVIRELTDREKQQLVFPKIRDEKAHIFLPLYSDRGKRHVPEKSGLNQWNAGGRNRDYNEVYIPIPIWIHRKFPEFFPPRDKSFVLNLPDGQALSAKLCQDNSKALMSNPNMDLGKWLLRQVMELREGELLTYERLEEIGLDSVIIYKDDDKNYSIDFTKIGAFDEFKKANVANKNKLY